VRPSVKDPVYGRMHRLDRGHSTRSLKGTRGGRGMTLSCKVGYSMRVVYAAKVQQKRRKILHDLSAGALRNTVHFSRAH